MGHDNHRRLSKLYAWEEKKTKTSWGAQTVGYEKRVSGFVLANPESKNAATAVVQAMKAADLNRFLVVCALISDLYCPGYNPKQTLGRDSNLARTAARYKVDTSQMVAGLRTELSKLNKASKQRAISPKTTQPSRASNRKRSK